MKDEAIRVALYEISRDQQVRILYACESGSRAWGMASKNSDYDVRFLYVRPQAAYLCLDLPRDVIERPITDDLDINGWDIFKALRLLRKSNPPLLEWLFSPIVYMETSPTIEELRAIARQRFSETSLFYHYRHMAEGNYRQYIAGKAQVPLKKYLYVVRPLVALIFEEQFHQIPSTNFLETLEQVAIDPAVRTTIQVFVDMKQSGEEMGFGAPSPVLNEWIEGQLVRWSGVPVQPLSGQDMTTQLNQVLDTILAERQQA